jgi:hypothetical protein
MNLPVHLARFGHRWGVLRVCLSLLAAAAVVFGTHVLARGLARVSTASAYRQASVAWARRDYRAAAGFLKIAVVMTWEGGLRSEAASVHLARTSRLRQAGNLQGSLRECAAAASTLGSDDDEGAVSYLCYTIEAEVGTPAGGP